MDELKQAVDIDQWVEQARQGIAQGTLPTTNTRPLKWRTLSGPALMRTKNFGKFHRGRLYLLQGDEQPVILLNLSSNGGKALVRYYVGNSNPFTTRSKHLTLIPGEYASFDITDTPVEKKSASPVNERKFTSPSTDSNRREKVTSSSKRPVSVSPKRVALLANEVPLSWQTLRQLNMLPVHWTEDDLKTIRSDEVKIVPLLNTDPVYHSVMKLLQLQDGVQAISKVIHPLSFLLFQLQQNPAGNDKLQFSYAFSNQAQDRTALARPGEDMIQLYAKPSQVPRKKTETVLYVSRHLPTTSLHLRSSQRFCEFVVVLEKKDKK